MWPPIMILSISWASKSAGPLLELAIEVPSGARPGPWRGTTQKKKNSIVLEDSNTTSKKIRLILRRSFESCSQDSRRLCHAYMRVYWTVHRPWMLQLINLFVDFLRPFLQNRLASTSLHDCKEEQKSRSHRSLRSHKTATLQGRSSAYWSLTLGRKLHGENTSNRIRVQKESWCLDCRKTVSSETITLQDKSITCCQLTQETQTGRTSFQQRASVARGFLESVMFPRARKGILCSTKPPTKNSWF